MIIIKYFGCETGKLVSKMITVKYFSCETGKLVREIKYTNTTCDKVMTELIAKSYKYIIGKSKDEIEVYF